jgi:hypothetical protein
VKAEVFGQEANQAARVWVADRFAEDLCGARGGPDQPKENLDRGGFSGAVGAKESEDFAGPHLEIEAIDGDDFAEFLTKIFYLDGRGFGHRMILASGGWFREEKPSFSSKIIPIRGEVVI